MAKNQTLNGMIHTMYSSETEMAKHMGWSRQRLNRITTGNKVPDLFEIRDIARALGASFMSLARIFLGDESTFGDLEAPDPLDPRTFP